MGAETRSWVTARPKRALHRQYLPSAPPEHESEQRPGASLYRDEPETCRRALRPFLRNLVFLGLLLAVFKVYRIEERAFQGRAFQMLVTLALVTLPAHYLAPFRWKKPLFVAISLAGLFWVFGVQVATIVVGFAAALIGICSLPMPWIGRAALMTALAAALACARPGMASAIIPDNVWPIVASMFMFRMILYLYELKHAKKPESLVDTLSYFFLLPNYCFMHFPVVDYRTMQRGYFADDVHAMQRRVWSATTCSISKYQASSISRAACSICSDSSFRRRTTATCSQPDSPTTGAGSTSTGKISWSAFSSIRSRFDSSDGRSPWRLHLQL
jgi:alginate O-acetyltransferase complex protein AlgI